MHAHATKLAWKLQKLAWKLQKHAWKLPYKLHRRASEGQENKSNPVIQHRYTEQQKLDFPQPQCISSYTEGKIAQAGVMREVQI